MLISRGPSSPFSATCLLPFVSGLKYLGRVEPLYQQKDNQESDSTARLGKNSLPPFLGLTLTSNGLGTARTEAAFDFSGSLSASVIWGSLECE